MLCEKSTPLQFIPNLKYLFKVSVTVTYSQRQEYPHFVGASLSLPGPGQLELPRPCLLERQFRAKTQGFSLTYTQIGR